jgi:hypothetical protein
VEQSPELQYSVTKQAIQKGLFSLSEFGMLIDWGSFAYVEFSDMEAVSNAMMLNESDFKGRQLKVTPFACVNL